MLVWEQPKQMVKYGAVILMIQKKANQIYFIKKYRLNGDSLLLMGPVPKNERNQVVRPGLLQHQVLQ